MDDLKTTTEIVWDILRRCPEARNSDNVLYYHVLSEVGKSNGIDIEHMSIPTFFLNLKKYGFPQFESVRRTRQKIQRSYPELAACDDVNRFRSENEQKYRDYSRKGVNL